MPPPIWTTPGNPYIKELPFDTPISVILQIVELTQDFPINIPPANQYSNTSEFSNEYIQMLLYVYNNRLLTNYELWLEPEYIKDPNLRFPIPPEDLQRSITICEGQIQALIDELIRRGITPIDSPNPFIGLDPIQLIQDEAFGNRTVTIPPPP